LKTCIISEIITVEPQQQDYKSIFDLTDNSVNLLAHYFVIYFNMIYK